MADPDHDRIAQAQSILAKVTDEWMTRPGVVSVEVARRWIDGAPTDAVGIRVTVSDMALQEREEHRLPDEVEGVPVDLVLGHPPSPES